MKDWEKVWLRTDSPFPREAMLTRTLVLDYEKFDEIRRRYAMVDIYSSLFSVAQLADDRLDTFLLDIDGTVTSAFRKMQLVLGKVIERLDYIPRVYCSGQGYHVYIDIEPVGSQQWRDYSNLLVDGLGIRSLVDRAIVGNPRALARYPGTMNSKTHWWMVRIDPLEPFSSVILRAKQDNQADLGTDTPLKWETFETRLMSYLGPRTHDVPERTVISRLTGSKCVRGPDSATFDGFPPCIENIIKEIEVSGECDHERRVFLGSVLVKVESTEEAMRRFERAGDYSEHRTRYQLEHLRTKGYTPTKCDTVAGWGICPGQCKYYPSIGRALRDRNIELRGMGMEREQWPND